MHISYPKIIKVCRRLDWSCLWLDSTSQLGRREDLPRGSLVFFGGSSCLARLPFLCVSHSKASELYLVLPYREAFARLAFGFLPGPLDSLMLSPSSPRKVHSLICYFMLSRAGLGSCVSSSQSAPSVFTPLFPPPASPPTHC